MSGRRWVETWVAPSDVERGAGETTDLANALRLCRRLHREIMFCREIGWLVWDGFRWATDQGAVELLAHRLPDLILGEAVDCTRLARITRSQAKKDALLERARQMMKWSRASGHVQRIAAALRMAEPHLEVRVDELDTNGDLLNVLNGTVDLRTGVLREHRREDLITRICSIAYDADAECPRWRQFIDEVTCGRPVFAGYLQRLFGYCLTDDVSEQGLYFFHGRGANGKTTLLQTIVTLMGDYACKAASGLMLQVKGDRIPTDVVDLRARRLGWTSELSKGAKWDTQRLRDLTGESTQKARRLYENYIEFPWTVKIIVSGNERPVVDDSTDATWRRLKLIPFDAKFPIDKTLAPLLARESPGILAWAVAGCLAWRREGLGDCPEIATAVAEYRQESDMIGRFLDECTERGDLGDPEFQCPGGELVSAMRAFMDARGLPRPSAENFVVALRERGVKGVQRFHRSFYPGLRLSTSFCGHDDVPS